MNVKHIISEVKLVVVVAVVVVVVSVGAVVHIDLKFSHANEKKSF